MGTGPPLSTAQLNSITCTYRIDRVVERTVSKLAFRGRLHRRYGRTACSQPPESCRDEPVL
ncbi:hypothetical protein HEK616_32020 [Streptomyces nigrescens]|uniref:Uncharacterized protein n=1 Tax=Streptomyces nigrescens TaxID=1920 RepID=A0ABM7ZTM0_STRNI|nr:hypothetical protein HEK616_32020 [Streptomyces nigrescens]